MADDPKPTVRSDNVASLDARLPSEIAARAEAVGAEKARLDAMTLFTLAMLAGAFIALGAIFSNLVASGSPQTLPFGVVRLLAGIAFSLGLVLVIVGGAELFTGNALMAMAWANRRIRGAELLRAWGIVLVGNAVGAIGTVGLAFLADHHTFGGGAVGFSALNAANAKAGLDPIPAFFRGVLCNVLVCLAVWLCLGARTTVDKIVAIIPPIAAFVAVGFEHSIGNIYIIPYGLMIKSLAEPAFWTSIGHQPAEFAALTWFGFLRNIVPVTLGNIFGGSVLVGGVYWFAYLRKRN